MKKKLISAMVYIYIAVVVGVVASAETITGLGVSIPIMNFLKYDSYTEDINGKEQLSIDGDEYENTKITGAQATIKLRHVFDSRFVLGADFDIGQATLKVDDVKADDKFTGLNFDLAIGYAVVDTERFTLVPSVIVGLQHAKQSLGSGTLFRPEYAVSNSGYIDIKEAFSRYTAFEIGGELFANFRIGDIVGLFASCKVLYDIGNFRMAFTDHSGNTLTYRDHKSTAVVVKPSGGVSFTF